MESGDDLKKRNFPANLTLGEEQKNINWIFAALNRRLCSIANSSHSLRRALRAEGEGQGGQHHQHNTTQHTGGQRGSQYQEKSIVAVAYQGTL